MLPLDRSGRRQGKRSQASIVFPGSHTKRPPLLETGCAPTPLRGAFHPLLGLLPVLFYTCENALRISYCIDHILSLLAVVRSVTTLLAPVFYNNPFNL